MAFARICLAIGLLAAVADARICSAESKEECSRQIGLFLSSVTSVRVPELQAVSLSQIKVVSVLAKTGNVTVRIVSYNGREIVMIQPKRLDPMEAKSFVLDKVPRSVQKRLASMTPDQAQALVNQDSTTHFLTEALEKVRPEKIAEHKVAEILADAQYTHSIAELKYNDRPIAPKIYGVVRNELGVPVGFLVELIQGKTLYDLAKNNELTPGQMKEIKAQFFEQLYLLHRAGKVHGDPHSRNILVEFEASTNKPRVRLIDFHPRSYVNEEYEARIALNAVEEAEHFVNSAKSSH